MLLLGCTETAQESLDHRIVGEDSIAVQNSFFINEWAICERQQLSNTEDKVVDKPESRSSDKADLLTGAVFVAVEVTVVFACLASAIGEGASILARFVSIAGKVTVVFSRFIPIVGEETDIFACCVFLLLGEMI